MSLEVSPRPWSEFFERFNVPLDATAEGVVDRLNTNLYYYRWNYVMVVGGISFYAMLTEAMVGLILIAYALGCVLATQQDIQVGQKTLVMGEKIVLVSLGAAVGLAFTGHLFRVLWLFFLCVALVALHALLRPCNIKSKLVNVARVVGQGG